jgi:hypothetical protein
LVTAFSSLHRDGDAAHRRRHFGARLGTAELQNNAVAILQLDASGAGRDRATCTSHGIAASKIAWAAQVQRPTHKLRGRCADPTLMPDTVKGYFLPRNTSMPWPPPTRTTNPPFVKTTLAAPVSVILILPVGCRRAFDDRELVLHLLADNQFLAAVAGEAQLAFLSDMERAGAYTALVEGLDRALKTLEAWGFARAVRDLRLGARHIRALGIIALHDQLNKNGAGCWAAQRRLAELARVHETELSHTPVSWAA